MRKMITIILFFFICKILLAQANNKEDTFGIGLKGFIKTDLFFDSRQTVSAREGHFLLYPQPENKDLLSEDINSSPSLNMLSIQSRLTGTISAPKFLNAKTSGVIEGAFFGHSDGDINGFRLRHAFLKLEWERTSLLIGQYWHPMFIPEVFPGVISFNTGVPFQPFSRNPQIKLTTKLDNLFLSFTAASQRDFASTGPDGASSKYLRNSAIPILDINLKFIDKNMVAGIGANFKTIKPYLEYNGYKVKNNLPSYSAIVFAKFDFGGIDIKIESVYGTNLNDLLMLGGYAINNYGERGELNYTASKTFSAWTDITFGKNSMFGIFAGYTRNLGTEEINNGTYFSRGSTIDLVWRISPRVEYKIENTKFACELEYTTADYGVPDNYGKVTNSSSISNLRALVAAYLFF